MPHSLIAKWLYAAACVAVPALWGLLMVWAAAGIERLLSRRRGTARHRDPSVEAVPLDYHI